MVFVNPEIKRLEEPMELSGLARDHELLLLIEGLPDRGCDRDLPGVDIDLLLDLVDRVEVLAVEGDVFKHFLDSEEVPLLELNGQAVVLQVLQEVFLHDHESDELVLVPLDLFEAELHRLH
jgi:hypothetical protein